MAVTSTASSDTWSHAKRRLSVTGRGPRSRMTELSAMPKAASTKSGKWMGVGLALWSHVPAATTRTATPNRVHPSCCADGGCPAACSTANRLLDQGDEPEDRQVHGHH